MLDYTKLLYLYRLIFSMKITSYLICALIVFSNQTISAQNAVFEGRAVSKDGGLPQVAVYFPKLGKGSTCNEDGFFKFENLPIGVHEVEYKLLGYKTKKIEIKLNDGQNNYLETELEEDILGLNTVVVSASRSEISQELSPIAVSIVARQTFERTQSLTLSEGLAFTPGLRVENNCQTCGFSQVRMNGLEGQYSQILINSRPVLSALAGVYGLDMMPTSMIERIEVIKGGGSTLYGGNAIAGTINIITKEPVENRFEALSNQSYFGNNLSERTLSFNTQVVNKTLNKGLSIYGYTRERDPWDANGDGFTELPHLKNKVLGAEGYWNVSTRSKLKAGFFQLKEFRRGGNKLDVEPHQSEIAEQLKHDISNAQITFERFSSDYKHKLSTYASGQWVKRGSYYGGLSDSLYGRSNDLTSVIGLQYNLIPNSKISITTGVENQHNRVQDNMPGYHRSVYQTSSTLGSYLQTELTAVNKLTLSLGLRADRVVVSGKYALNIKDFHNNIESWVYLGRFSAMYEPIDNLKIRASLAQGYRAPQTFSEDLHVEMIGGSARFIALSDDLKMERSISSTLSVDYRTNTDMAVNISGFWTTLQNPFILSEPYQDQSGVSIITKRNGGGATVKGINIETSKQFSPKFAAQLGGTLQTALHHNEELIWSSQTESVSTTKMLRTPDVYGYFTALYNPNKALKFSGSGVFTGSMALAEVVDFETERTVIRRTPNFLEINTKASYLLPFKWRSQFEIFAGVQNLLNSFQKDFQVGAHRDSGYIYGPLRGRTVFFGLKIAVD